MRKSPDSKVHGVIVGPIWGRQDPDGPHVGPMNFAIWEGALDVLVSQVVRYFQDICYGRLTLELQQDVVKFLFIFSDL